MKYIRSILSLCVPLLFTCNLSYAADTDTPAASPGGKPAKTNKIGGNGSLGYSVTGGNTESDSLNARLSLKYEREQWTHKIQLTGLNISVDDETVAERYRLAQRNRYNFRGKYSNFFGYGGLRYNKDRFSGFEYQASVATGLVWHALQLDRYRLSFRFGGGYRHSEDVLGEQDKEGIFQLGTLHSFMFSKNTVFKQEVLVEAGEENTILDSVTSLKVGVTSKFFLELIHNLTHNSDPPDDTASTNRNSSVNFTYKF